MIDLPPKLPPARGTVILLHGWGGNSRDAELLAEALRIPNLRYLIPEGAYDVPGTEGRGKGWYSLPLDEKAQRERAKSRQQLFGVLRDLEKTGTPPGNIVLMGFSQGASMSLDVALNYPSANPPDGQGEKKWVAGVISLSGFLLDGHDLLTRRDVRTDIPIFAAHGTFDPLIPLDQGKQSIMTLKKAGFQVEWKEYEADHRVVIEELEDIRKFLSRVFSL